MNFEQALHHLKDGKKVARDDWPQDHYLNLTTNFHSFDIPRESSPFIFYVEPARWATAKKERSFKPWLPDFDDLFSDSWRVVGLARGAKRAVIL